MKVFLHLRETFLAIEMELTVDCLEALHHRLNMLSFSFDQSKLQYFHIDLIPDRDSPGTGKYVTRSNAYDRCEELVQGIRRIVTQLPENFSVETDTFNQIITLLRNLCTTTDAYQLANFLQAHPVGPPVSSNVWDKLQRLLPYGCVGLLAMAGVYVSGSFSSAPSTAAGSVNSGRYMPTVAEQQARTSRLPFAPFVQGGMQRPVQRKEQQQAPLSDVQRQKQQKAPLSDLQRTEQPQAPLSDLQVESEELLIKTQNVIKSPFPPLDGLIKIPYFLFVQDVRARLSLNDQQRIGPSIDISPQEKDDFAEAVMNVTEGCINICSEVNLCLQFKASFNAKDAILLSQDLRDLYKKIFTEIESLSQEIAKLHCGDFQEKACSILDDLHREYHNKSNSSAIIVADQSVGELKHNSNILASVIKKFLPTADQPVTKEEQIRNIVFFNTTFSQLLPDTVMETLLGADSKQVAQTISDMALNDKLGAYAGNKADGFQTWTLMYALFGEYIEKFAPSVFGEHWGTFTRSMQLHDLMDKTLFQMERAQVRLNKDLARLLKKKHTNLIGDILSQQYHFLAEIFKTHYIEAAKKKAGLFATPNLNMLDEYYKIVVQYLRASFEQRMQSLKHLTGEDYTSMLGIFSDDSKFLLDPGTPITPDTLQFVQNYLRPYTKNVVFRLRRFDFSQVTGQLQGAIVDLMSGSTVAREAAQFIFSTFLSNKVNKEVLEKMEILPTTDSSWRSGNPFMEFTDDFDFKAVEIRKQSSTSLQTTGS